MHAFGASPRTGSVGARLGLGFLALALALALAVLPVPAPAQTGPGAPSAAPIPPPRPVLPGDPEPAPAAEAGETPAPPPRPSNLDAALVPAGQRPPAADERPPEADDGPCLARLKELAIQFEVLPPLSEGACGATRPLKLIRLADDVAISPPATTVCAMAEAIAQWSRTVVVPEAKRLMQARPKAIAIGTSYQCRTRNHVPGAKLSEHAFANAVDVSGIQFHDRASVTIGTTAADTPEGRYALAIQSGACASFNTVLGPGSDVEHGNHLHVDLRGRRNGYRICQ